jgi:hypothetical protein
MVKKCPLLPSTHWTLSRVNHKKLFSFILILFISALVVDTVLNYVADYLVPQLSSNWGTALFVAIAAISCTGQFFILEYVRQRSKEMRLKYISHKVMQITVMSVQYLLVSIFVILIVQIILSSQYYTVLLTTGYLISHSLNITMLILPSFWLILWYLSNRSSIAVLLYGISFIVMATASAIITLEHLIVLTGTDQVITHTQTDWLPFPPGSLLDTLSNFYQPIDATSFIIIWLATVTLLHHYARKIGVAKFWILIILPLLYFLSTFVSELGIYIPETEREEFFFLIYVSLNSTGGGILFAIAFRSVAQSLRQDSAVRDYMSISAVGFILVFISNQVAFTINYYPPFGFSTMSTVGLSAYLIMIGLYSSAVSVSQDSKLRQSIRKFATNDSNLLSSIGTAHMEREIQRTVNSMKGIVQEQENELEKQSGIEANMEEDEMKNYLEEVMQEVGKTRKPSA